MEKIKVTVHDGAEAFSEFRDEYYGEIFKKGEIASRSQRNRKYEPHAKRQVPIP